jgi:acetyl-CoA C-acetyltransferase
VHPVDPHLPVVVGLGATSHPAPVTSLMADSARAAASDAGVPGLLAAVDAVLVPQGSWSLTDPGRTVALVVGATHARSVLFQIGVSQQELINHALGLVQRGGCDMVLVVGGEARAWARDGGVEEDDAGAPPDELVTRPPDFVAAIEQAAGIVLPPVLQYALIENALASTEGVAPADHRREVATLWARFNEVARTNPDAAFGAPMGAEEIATSGPRNRPLAFPYNRWHASQWTVDQAAALLVCRAEVAKAAGVPADRWLFPHVALHSSDAVTLTARRQLHAWPAMAVLGRAAEAGLGRPLRSLSLAEVYSCFPAAVRVQQRALGLDLDGTPTLTGGMAFAGGPFNNYVLQSMVALGQRLRAAPDELGLVTTVSGMLSKPGLAVWSATPPEARLVPDLGADLAAPALAATDRAPVLDAPPPERVEGRVASYSVLYGGEDGLAPTRTAIVVDLAEGVRSAATCDDADTARLAVTQGLVGRRVDVKDTTFSL